MPLSPTAQDRATGMAGQAPRACFFLQLPRPGYAENCGDSTQSGWRVGISRGFKGPWGTTCHVNLRLKLKDKDETARMKYSGELRTRRPIPNCAVRAMSEDARRAIYRFTRSLDPGGACSQLIRALGLRR
jgi:hypothetical protein